MCLAVHSQNEVIGNSERLKLAMVSAHGHEEKHALFRPFASARQSELPRNSRHACSPGSCKIRKIYPLASSVSEQIPQCLC